MAEFKGKDLAELLRLAVRDDGLPKHRALRKVRADEEDGAMETSGLSLKSASSTSVWVEGTSGGISMSGVRNSLYQPPEVKPGLLRMIAAKLLPWGKYDDKQAEPALLAIFRGADQLQEAKMDEAALKETAEEYRGCGQIALAEKIEETLPVVLMEQKLLRSGFDRYLHVRVLSDFFDRYGKTFTASWLRNFLRPIPKHAADLKKKADGLMVFDCYLLIHPHPDPRSIHAAELSKPTKEEKKSRDPILLGYVLGSDRLYYIDSWIDPGLREDLDLERFVKLISEKSGSATSWDNPVGGIKPLRPAKPAEIEGEQQAQEK